MSLPKHIEHVPDNRKAVAPYNFVELPDRIVTVDPKSLPSGNRYYPDHYTGIIKCTLTTESPLYTRCGWTPEDFAEYLEPPKHKTEKERKRWEKEEKAEWEKKRKKILAPFFSYPGQNLPVIPGSSIRGMLRTLVEIISFSKIDRVSDAQKFFFRAVAAEREDPLADPYKKALERVQAGYLTKQGESWFIRPAKKIDDLSFVWIKDEVVNKSLDDFISLKSDSYYPQYKINVSFENTTLKNGRRFSKKISSNPSKYKNVGVLVTSGNMAETGEASQTNRKNHCLVREPDSEAQLIKINDDAIRDYCSALTAFQTQSPNFTEQEGVLAKGRCIFYCEPQTSKEDITLFGQSPYFRIPYSHAHNGKAATARDFIPPRLKDTKDHPVILDMAEAMFGFVRRDKQANQNQQARSSRIFISDAIPQAKQEAAIQSSLDQEPQEILLSSPKPTTFQHYLVQPKAEQKTLQHYASQPPTEQHGGETAIRGHKLYWHKKYEGLSVLEDADTQTSLIKPIDPEIEFTFDIHFENLSDVELGALLWILSLSNDKSKKLLTGKIDKDEKYCFSLGMGKPLGMGAVTIDYELYLSDRHKRYLDLFNEAAWEQSETVINLEQEKFLVKAFEDFMLAPSTGISSEDCKRPDGGKAYKLNQTQRIEMLLAILRFGDHAPSSDQTRYMTIEAEEYKKRPVLPTPLQVVGWEDTKNFRVGQRLEARVIEKKKGNKVKYEIDGFRYEEKESKQFKNIPESGQVIVEIKSIKDDGCINHIKFVQKVDE
jgi:CRISPR-associated protein (TIGR03986 family)